MFCNTFPLAAIFSLATNLLDINNKIKSMCIYGRRFIPEGDSGIGEWLNILEFVVIVSIPINCAVLVFSGTYNPYTGKQESSL